MRAFKQLRDPELLRALEGLVAGERTATADLVACIAEVDGRRLYAPAGYPSMFEYCVGAFHMSEAEAFLRIRAARSARRFPGILAAIADGRLHLTAVALLSRYLTRTNAEELLKAATRRTKAEIRVMLAERFPRPDIAAAVTLLRGAGPGGASPELRPDAVGAGAVGLELRPDAVGAGAAGRELRPDAVAMAGAGSPDGISHELRPDAVGASAAGLELRPDAVGAGATGLELRPDAVALAGPGAPGGAGKQLRPDAVGAHGAHSCPTDRSALEPPRSDVAPLSAGRYGARFTMDQETFDLLEQAQALLGHQVPSGDLGEVMKRALLALVAQLEKRKFAATQEPRAPRPASRANPRHIPAHVKRDVWARDGGRCTFVGDRGHRCTARKFLEFDHAVPVARGGRASVANLRLRCRMHNQIEAERTFGADFMNSRREASGRSRLSDTRAGAGTGVAVGADAGRDRSLRDAACAYAGGRPTAGDRVGVDAGMGQGRHTGTDAGARAG